MPEIARPLQILPHPKRGTMEIGTERILPVWCSIRAAEGATDEKPVITIRGTDGSEDRHGTPIAPRGWDFAPYMKHRIALWAHGVVDHWPYVGITQDLRSAGGDGWDFSIELLIPQWRHLDVNMPAFLWETYRDHNVAALSVSFIPKEWEDYEAKEMPTYFAEGVRYKKQELTEISFVNVPSNRNAVAKTFDRWRSAGRASDGLARMLGYDVSPIILRTAKEAAMSTRTVVSFGRELATMLKRCCACEPSREPKPEVVDDPQRSVEVDLMADMARAHLAALDAAMNGWRNSKERQNRSNYTAIITTALWEIEGLIWRAKEWYGEDLAIDLPAYAVDELEPIVSAANPEGIVRAMRAARRAASSSEKRAEVRAKFQAILRCCGCYPCEDETPTLPTDDSMRTHEAGLLREIAESSMQQVELGMRAWTTAATDRLRSMAQTLIMDGMWRFDTSVRYLAEWYGEEVEALPDVEVEEVERALAEHHHLRAGAVFSKKNLTKIDQVIEIMTELRAAANKPTPEDVPDEERKLRAARVAQFAARMAGPFEYASTQVNLPDDAAEHVFALAATIPDDALAEKGRETDPHVTVKFGIDAAVTPNEVQEAIENSDSAKEIAARGGTMTLGATAVFEADDYDVVYVAVESPDLVLLNEIISASVPVTDTKPEYIPHATLAYVKKGEGAKYAGDETLAGVDVTFDAISFSDVNGDETEIPLAGEAAPPAEPVEARGAIKFRIKNTGSVTNEQVTKSRTLRVLVPDAAADRIVESPSGKRSFYLDLLND